MRKIVLVGDQEYELGTNGYTPIAYKQQFGKDYFQDLFSMLSDFDMTFFNRLFWTFAKSANPQIKPYEQFFMEMEIFPIQEVGPVLMEMLNASMTTKKHQMNQNQLAKKSSQ
ncbi:TPA: hypothetical protein ACL4SC_001597 [Streptococcus pneumoniae]